MDSGVIAFWRRWFLLVEPLLVVLIVAMIVYWSEELGGWRDLDWYLHGVRETLYSTLAGLSGSLLGFVIAALAITVAAFRSDRLGLVRKHVQTLVATFSAATLYLGVATLVSIAALLFDRDADPIPLFFYSVVLVLALSAVALARCVWILHNVVSIVSAPPKDRAGDQ